MNLQQIIHKQNIKIEETVSEFLSSKEGQALIKKTIISDLKNFINDASVDDILSHDMSKKYYIAIEKAVAKRLHL